MTRPLRSKVDQLFSLSVAKVVARIRPRFGTAISYRFYRRNGMDFEAGVNYISTTAWFDGTDYSLISIGREVTISSDVSFLTHDWSLHTIGKSLGVHTDEPLGITKRIDVGPYCFIGRGATLMPGTKLGEACVVGAGSVVRGEFPARSLIVGNPAEVVSDTARYFNKKVDPSLLP